MSWREKMYRYDEDLGMYSNDGPYGEDAEHFDDVDVYPDPIPVTVKQILDPKASYLDGYGLELTYKAHLSKFTFVGFVTENIPAQLFTLNDGTGVIVCLGWHSVKYGENPLQYSMYRKYFRVTGSLIYSSRRGGILRFFAEDVQPVTGYDDIVNHYVTCIDFHRKNPDLLKELGPDSNGTSSLGSRFASLNQGSHSEGTSSPGSHIGSSFQGSDDNGNSLSGIDVASSDQDTLIPKYKALLEHMQLRVKAKGYGECVDQLAKISDLPGDTMQAVLDSLVEIGAVCISEDKFHYKAKPKPYYDSQILLEDDHINAFQTTSDYFVREPFILKGLTTTHKKVLEHLRLEHVHEGRGGSSPDELAEELDMPLDVLLPVLDDLMHKGPVYLASDGYRAPGIQFPIAFDFEYDVDGHCNSGS